MCLVITNCTFEIEAVDTGTPVYYENSVTELEYCMYDPLPLEAGMQYCDSYSNAECCMWEQWHSDDWICEYHWCFYWDSCEWEYIDSECWW